MSHILGPYCSFWHWRKEDEDYIRELDPAWARIHQPTARAIHTVYRNAPNANVMLRSWDIDDHNGDRKCEMYTDPKGAALKHLDMWASKYVELVRELHNNGWGFDQTKWFLGLVNEPDPNYAAQVVEYSLEAMRIAKGRGWHLGLVCSSVGTFSKPSENDHGWAQFKPLEQPINDGGHILIVHEYWQPEGPNFGEDAGNLAWRHHSIPLDVPILIGESGANGYIYQRYSKEDDAGWQKTVKDPNVFAGQVKQYIEGCDQRVKGVLLYMLDFHSEQWWSFDTQPAMYQLLAIKDARPQVESPFSKPVKTVLPIVGGGVSQLEENWQRSRAFVRKWEGGLSLNPEDHGNWTGGRKGQGELKGTNFGISAASYPHLDIRNLTIEQADAIYFKDYWQASGADRLPYPYCLLVFDTAVLHGVGTAKKWVSEVGDNAYAFAAKRLKTYTRLDNWHYFGAGWVNRTAELLEAASAN